MKPILVSSNYNYNYRFYSTAHPGTFRGIFSLTYIIFIFVLLSSLSSFSFGQGFQTDPFDINTKNGNDILAFSSAQIFYEKNQPLTIEQIQQPENSHQFVDYKQQQQSSLQTPGIYWYRFAIKNSSDDETTYYLTLNNQRINQLDLYQVTSQSKTNKLYQSWGRRRQAPFKTAAKATV